MSPSPQRWLNGLLAGIFAVLIAAPGLATFLPRKPSATGGGEHRQLAPSPTWAWRKEVMLAFPRGFDAWFQDHFGFRDAFIRAHALLMYKVLHTTPSARVMLGREKYLFYNGAAIKDGDPIADYRGHRPLSALQLETWRWYFEDVQAWCADHGIRYMLVTLPGKETAYHDMLPAGLPKVGPSVIEQMTDYLDGRATYPHMNATATLDEARRAERTFLVTDTHWTAYGAFMTYREIARRLQSWFPNLRVPELSDFDMRHTDGMGGDLARMISLSNEIREPLIELDPKTPARWKIERFGDPSNPNTLTTVAGRDAPSAVIFRDSFTEVMIPYFADGFRRVYLHEARTGVYIQPMEAEKPDVVLQIITDRMFRQGQRFDPDLRAYGAAKRFGSATNVLATWDSSNRFEGIQPDPDTTATIDGPSLVVQGSERRPILILPEIDGSKQLPIIRMEIVSQERTDATVRWLKPDEGVTDYGLVYYASGQLEPGTNVVHIPLIDPSIRGPLRLDMGRRGVPYAINSVVIRGVPR